MMLLVAQMLMLLSRFRLMTVMIGPLTGRASGSLRVVPVIATGQGASLLFTGCCLLMQQQSIREQQMSTLTRSVVS